MRSARFRILAMALLALPFALGACVSGVNGSVDVAAGTSVSDASTVNGSVNLEANAKADTGGLRVYGEFQTGAVKNTLSAQTFRIFRHYTILPAATGADYSYTGKRSKLAYKGEAQLGAKARLVFGAFEPKTGAVGSLWDVVRDRRLTHRPQVRGGVLAEDCAALLEAFFSRQRDLG